MTPLAEGQHPRIDTAVADLDRSRHTAGGTDDLQLIGAAVRFELVDLGLKWGRAALS